jgi:hypothetical protein
VPALQIWEDLEERNNLANGGDAGRKRGSCVCWNWM